MHFQKIQKRFTSLSLWCSLILLFTLPILACGSDQTAGLPTLAATAAVPTATPLPTPTPPPTPTFEPHTNIVSLISKVVGERLDRRGLNVMTTTDMGVPPHPEGRIGHSVDIYIANPDEASRKEMLQMIYDLMHEYHYNTQRDDLLYFHVIIREDISECLFSMGLGYEAAEELLPKETPDDLEAWFAVINNRDYYGYSISQPNQRNDILAFADDYGNVATCEVEHWKKGPR